MTQSSDASATGTEGFAPLGGPAERETPVHTADPDASGQSLEESTAYELAVEDGAPLPAAGEDPGSGPLAPEFREPGEG